MHHAQRHLDDGIVRSVWLSLDELKATEHLHRSPIVLESVGDYLAGQRYDIGLIHADASIYKVPQLTRPVPEEAGATLDDVLVPLLVTRMGAPDLPSVVAVPVDAAGEPIPPAGL